ncbi:Helix-turn-helix transcriptional regulator OS=Streptomyces fumanus OX=67302 GN=GCM10018772_11030 PE=4 SV=1 [Streptomyces fumanus]
MLRTRSRPRIVALHETRYAGVGRAMAGHGSEEHPHGADRLCAAGDRVYSRAVGAAGCRAGTPAGGLLELALRTPIRATWTGWSTPPP